MRMFAKKEQLNSDAKKKRIVFDFITEKTTLVISLLMGLVLFAIIGFILYKSIVGFQYYGIKNILFSNNFNISDGKATGVSFWLPFSSTLLTTIISLLIAVPIGIKTSVFIKFRIKKKYRKIFRIISETLAGIPSVIFGLFASISLGEIMKFFGISSYSIINASIMLSFMVLPTIIAMTINSLESVDDNLLTGKTMQLAISSLYDINIDVTKLEAAYSEKTKAVMIAHTLGNPFDLEAVKQFCDKHNLWLIEDNCDALGSKYRINGEERFTGTIGDIGTSSFYPPHHMTMGEGGAVYTKNPLLNRIIRSFRDWGRDCVCPSGRDNLCGHRFDRQYGELPIGYDHKYVYSHFGYNLKATDMQAAIGCAQIKKFPTFVERRIHNFNRLRAALEDCQDKLILPEACPNSTPSWFGFLITCKEGVDRNKVVQYVEQRGVQTRMLFSGNLIKHPCFDQMRASGEGYRVVGSLENTDRFMNHTFWVGVYPGMTVEKIDYMAKVIKEAL